MSWVHVPKQKPPSKKHAISPKFAHTDSGSSKQSGLNKSGSSISSASTSRKSLKSREQSLGHVNLISNAYGLGSKHLKNKVYEYVPQISISEGFRDLSPQILFRNFVSRSIRRTIINEIIPQLVGSNIPKGSIVIEQNLEAIYSLKPFKLINSNELITVQEEKSSDNIFRFDNISIKADLLTKLHVDITLKFVKSYVMDSLKFDNTAIINSILNHKLWINMLKYGSVYYPSEDCRQEAYERNRLDLMSQHVMGLSMSGLRKTLNSETIIVIHCPHSYITNSHRLIDLLASFIFNRPIVGLKLLHGAENRAIEREVLREIRSIIGTEDWFSSFSSILNGFKCKSDDRSDDINFYFRFKLTDKSASDLLIVDPKIPDKLITVREFYRSQFNINLNYPNLPCIASNSSKNPYYPFEMCSLLPDQKVPIFRLSTIARNHLNHLNKPKPELAQKLSYEAKDKIEFIAKDELQRFGIYLSKNPIEAEGSILNRPLLQFQNQFIEPQRDHWESGKFYKAMHLVDNWCVVNTIEIDEDFEKSFFINFSDYCRKFGVNLGRPYYLFKSKNDFIENENSICELIKNCFEITRGHLLLILFVIDSNSTQLNRLIHLSFDEHDTITATCLRKESIMNNRQHKSIYRTLVHKLNARLGGTNVTYHNDSLKKLNLNSSEIMIIGLDVTHPDNEMSGFSIVGCAYTYDSNLFKHKSLVWPQAARVEIIGKLDVLMKRILYQYYSENNQRLPKYIIVYRDGVSHEEFDRIKDVEVEKVQNVLIEAANETNQERPNLSYVIAQKRHTMRFFHRNSSNHNYSNPPSGTLIDQNIITKHGQEFYLYSHTSHQATARPLHYHVLKDGIGFENLQKLTYFLCFNFGKCSGTLSMPSSLKYAHNAAYDARNRVIAAKEFNENKFYPSKFFC